MGQKIAMRLLNRLSVINLSSLLVLKLSLSIRALYPYFITLSNRALGERERNYITTIQENGLKKNGGIQQVCYQIPPDFSVASTSAMCEQEYHFRTGRLITQSSLYKLESQIEGSLCVNYLPHRGLPLCIELSPYTCIVVSLSIYIALSL